MWLGNLFFLQNLVSNYVAKPARHFCVYRPYKESISTDINNDNGLNLQKSK